MNDLEEHLAASLTAYVGGVTPASGGFDDIVTRARRRDRCRLLGRGAVSFAIVVGLVTVGWQMTRDATTRVDVTDPGPSITAGSETSGTWTVLSPSPLSPRLGSATAWTGTEFIVAGGRIGETALNDGAAYNPSTNTWRSIAPMPLRDPRVRAAWTGTEMVAVAKGTAAAYNPSTDIWSELPGLDLDEAEFIDLVWTGDELLVIGGVGYSPAEIRVRSLDRTGEKWDDHPSLSSVTGGGYTVPLGDGFATVTGHGFGGVPKGSDLGWRFSVAEGWSSLPPVPDLPGWNVQSGVPVVVGGRLIIVVNLQKSDGSASATGVTELRDEGWTVPQRVSDVSIGLPQAVAMGDLIAVVGANTTDGRSPLVIDPQAGRATVMDDYPIPTVIDQSLVWSGMELFIWGGQTSQRDGEASTSATGTFSADGAIWRP